MGLVLAFQAAPRAASRPSQRRPVPTNSADILFFTGVRYERQEVPRPQSSQAPRALDLSPPSS
jgi:hypothetical protein